MSEELLDLEKLKVNKQEAKQKLGIGIIAFFVSFIFMDLFISFVINKYPKFSVDEILIVGIFAFTIIITWSVYIPKMLNNYYPESDILVLPFVSAFTAAVLIFFYKIFQTLVFSKIAFFSIDVAPFINTSFLLGIITFLIANIVIRKVRKQGIAWAIALIFAIWIVAGIFFTFNN